MHDRHFLRSQNKKQRAWQVESSFRRKRLIPIKLFYLAIVCHRQISHLQGSCALEFPPLLLRVRLINASLINHRDIVKYSRPNVGCERSNLRKESSRKCGHTIIALAENDLPFLGCVTDTAVKRTFCNQRTELPETLINHKFVIWTYIYNYTSIYNYIQYLCSTSFSFAC